MWRMSIERAKNSDDDDDATDTHGNSNKIILRSSWKAATHFYPKGSVARIERHCVRILFGLLYTFVCVWQVLEFSTLPQMCVCVCVRWKIVYAKRNVYSRLDYFIHNEWARILKGVAKADILHSERMPRRCNCIFKQNLFLTYLLSDGTGGGEAL